MSTTLVPIYNPANFSYPQVVNESHPLVQVEELETPFAVSLITNENLNQNYSGAKRVKSDLPLTSDFGEIENPYELVFARLEGLQY